MQLTQVRTIRHEQYKRLKNVSLAPGFSLPTPVCDSIVLEARCGSTLSPIALLAQSATFEQPPEE